ncbi:MULTISPECIES: hypothetical protein [unclassified Frondihabitans]|uniref:hypothetical protein n=1 Tax=unclassified Frondihabitans TaxID=2626248 RepID=UPI000F4DF490|nr:MULTISPECIES: hypothetical protein [unclassified Frondihabitans]RPE75210.1 hypothetical protein EDF37_2814 [Frondihabitans sp. PhB153]RPF04452.1 hypothetical protein EDF39_2882 [Frondihabitans sp. PhB161]
MKATQILDAAQQAHLDHLTEADADHRALLADAKLARTAYDAEVSRKRIETARLAEEGRVRLDLDLKARCAESARVRDQAIRATFDSGVLIYHIAQKRHGVHSVDYGIVRASLDRTEPEA